MKKEELQTSPIVTLEMLANQTEEQWQQNWQDFNFAKTFPNRTAEFVSPKTKIELSEHDRKLMVERSHTTFMTLPWKPGAPKAVAGISVPVDENLNPLPPTFRATESGRPTESLLRVNIGCHMLMGKSLEDKDYIDNLMFQRFSDFTSAKKTNFRSHLFRLIKNDNLFANWVKRHNFDAQNGFEWNRDVALLLLRVTKSVRNAMLSELTGDLKIYPLEVIDVFVDKAQTLLEGVSRSRIVNDTSIEEFKIRLGELTQLGYFDGSPLSLKVQTKIEELTNIARGK